MDRTERAEAFAAREDALIGVAVPRISAMLESFSDQISARWTELRAYSMPSPAMTDFMVDEFTQIWGASLTLGYDLLDTLTIKNSPEQLLVEYMNNYGSVRIQRVAGTTLQQVINIVTSGQREGFSAAEIAEALSEQIPQIAATRAKIIAETEVHAAAQYGAYRTALASGRTMVKEWHTRGDGKVRNFPESAFSHVLMNGNSVALENAFQVPMAGGGFESLRFPGDPEGSAGNVINCRCLSFYREV